LDIDIIVVVVFLIASNLPEGLNTKKLFLIYIVFIHILDFFHRGHYFLTRFRIDKFRKRNLDLPFKDKDDAVFFFTEGIDDSLALLNLSNLETI
jgi:hypothetical protein